MSEATLPTVEDALALGLTRAEYELVCEKQGCAAQPGRARDVLAAVERALRLQALQEAAAHAAHRGRARGHGARGERRRGRRRRRAGVRLQGRVAQPPERGRAVPGGRDRASAGSCATSSRSARGRSRCSTRCASASRPATRSRYLLDGAVAGIGHYGNSIGVPTVGGEVYFEAPYEQNCLVNAMALGLAPRERLIRAAAAGPGNVLLLFGASTGRDGIGGASVLASAELGHEDEGADKRPTVQVGDPFEEKKLLECSLELLDRGLLVSLQDLGAAGLTSSASEMASKGEVGIDIDIVGDPAARAGDGALRDHGQRVAGADAVRGRALERRRRDRRLRALGGLRGGDRDGHRQRQDAGPARRRAARRHARQGAGRRLPAL